jgi:ribose transport system permease protein
MTTPTSQDYERRIAALEQRLQSFEGRLAPPSVQRSKTEFAERFGLLIAWVLLILVLGYYKPEQIFAWNSFASMFGSNAMIVVLTLGLIIPLTTGDFDLSVASTMAIASMLIAVLNVRMGWSIEGSIVLAVLLGAAIGAVNAFFILWFGIHSLIVTLGVGYFINGVVLWMSGSNVISGVSMDLVNVVILTRFLGVPLSFWFAVILTVIIWYVFQHTALGRRLLFVGRGREVARLSGVNVTRVRAGALIASGAIAALAGVLYTGMRGSADPSSALAFLLPAFAAAFLGSTTLYPGRFNAPGAFVAVYFLSTGIMGLNFMGVPSFVQNLFYGGGLVIAVSISQLLRKRRPMD